MNVVGIKECPSCGNKSSIVKRISAVIKGGAFVCRGCGLEYRFSMVRRRIAVGVALFIVFAPTLYQFIGDISSLPIELHYFKYAMALLIFYLICGSSTSENA